MTRARGLLTETAAGLLSAMVFVSVLVAGVLVVIAVLGDDNAFVTWGGLALCFVAAGLSARAAHAGVSRLGRRS